MKLWLLTYAGLALVVWTAVDQPTFAWLIGPGSLLHWLLPGTQHVSPYEGIEGIWFFATLPVLIQCVRHQRAFTRGRS